MIQKKEIEIAGRKLSLETGRVAKQAGGSVWAQYGDTVVLAAACGATSPKPGFDFFPLTVDYREKTYAAGKIPGGFFKREGKARDGETLTARLIDRPMRPLFPEGFRNEVQIQILVLSHDRENDPGLLSMIAASAALNLSEIPFKGVVSGVSVGKVDGKLVINPSLSQAAQSSLDLVVAGTEDSIMMVEGEAGEMPESEMVEALALAHAEIKKLCAFQKEFFKPVAKTKMPWEKGKSLADELEPQVKALGQAVLEQANRTPGKLERQKAVDEARTKIAADWKAKNPEAAPEAEAAVGHVLESMESSIIRLAITKEGRRVDGRKLDEVRPVSVELGVIPRTHGSAIFTRGQTQALVTTTLGAGSDAMIMDELTSRWEKNFYLHYNFPSFSVGEVKPNRGPGRREIGHGMLAERAIKAVMPKTSWPYVTRVVSEILESNGSSSMASVCGASLALMDAGVPTTAPVAGIAMGLVAEEGQIAILTDIQGAEDHFGDMDFKVAGTRKGITAIQMDIKIAGVSREVLTKALDQAKAARLHILGIMDAAIAKPRTELSPYAPRITVIKVNPEKLGAIIGPGGKMIRKIQTDCGVDVNVEDDGSVSIASPDSAATQKAVEMIKGIVEDVEVGKVYKGKVVKIMEFGAFVEVRPGKDGLVHISQLAHTRVNAVEDVVKVGDDIEVKVLEVDDMGKIRLSHKALLPLPEGMEAQPEEAPRPRRSFGDRGPRRDGDRGPRRDFDRRR